jgi:hypothetical protein
MNAILTQTKRLNGKQIRTNERENAAQTYQKQGDAGIIIKMPQIVSNFWGMFILEAFVLFF